MGYTDYMKFVVSDPESVARAVGARMRTLLQSKPAVLWLVSGGSNIPIQHAIMEMVPDSLSRKLVIVPVDERFGPFGHKDSNSRQMRDAGFDPKHAEWIDPLDYGLSLAETVRLFNDTLSRKIADGAYIVGTFGVGADGHTAGILPYSPALHSSEIAVGYNAPDYTRITICADSIASHCDEAYISAFGENKKEAVMTILRRSDTREKIPALLFHNVDSSILYNDFIEKESV